MFECKTEKGGNPRRLGADRMKRYRETAAAASVGKFLVDPMVSLCFRFQVLVWGMMISLGPVVEMPPVNEGINDAPSDNDDR